MVQDNNLRYQGSPKYFRDETQIRNHAVRTVGESWVTDNLSSQIKQGNSVFVTGRDFYRESLALYKNGLRQFNFTVISENSVQVNFEINGADELYAVFVPM